MTTDTAIAITSTLLAEVRRRRIFYHNVNIIDGVCTRFDEDYDEVPYLTETDAALDRLVHLLDAHIVGGFDGRTVLDVGCAEGLFSVHAARCGAARVMGIERNRCTYQRACFIQSAADLDNVSFRNGSVASVDCDERFDHVLALNLLYHLVSPLDALRRLRTWCADRLYVTVPIEVDRDDDSPLVRLDRYQTDGHGFWAFSVAFVRQMFDTAGFHIETEYVMSRHADSGRPMELFIVAKPLPSTPHHIFDDVIDQAFPPSYSRRRAALRRAWPTIGKRFSGPVAILGAGRHTKWMLEQVADLRGPSIECILDDRARKGETVKGIAVRRPTDGDAERFSAVLISTWFQHETLLQRSREIFASSTRVIALTDQTTPDDIH